MVQDGLIALKPNWYQISELTFYLLKVENVIWVGFILTLLGS